MGKQFSRVKKEFNLEIVNANSSLYAVKNYLVEMLLGKGWGDPCPSQDRNRECRQNNFAEREIY